MTGTIFDIQRFSVHDGPGIRTTVFMKGCPLRCKWCHNPEGLSSDITLQFFSDECIGCKLCGKRSNLSDAQKCPSQALIVCGRTITSQELISEVLKDKDFYADDGGVTFSGGECLLQPDFVAEVMALAKKEGLTTAVDTCGFVPRSAFEKIADVCDLYLYDIKCIDADIHKAFTGVDNTIILENIRWLCECNRKIWIRVPLIPDFNCSEKEITNIANFIASLPGVLQVTLMPYHSLGASKYKTLGMEYEYDTSKKVTDEQFSSFCKIFTDRNIVLN